MDPEFVKLWYDLQIAHEQNNSLTIAPERAHKLLDVLFDVRIKTAKDEIKACLAHSPISALEITVPKWAIRVFLEEL